METTQDTACSHHDFCELIARDQGGWLTCVVVIPPTRLLARFCVITGKLAVLYIFFLA